MRLFLFIYLILLFSGGLLSQEIIVSAKKIDLNESDSNEVNSSNIQASDLKENVSIDTESVGFGGVSQVGIRGLGKGSVTTFLDEVELTDSSDINGSSQLQYINFSILKNYSLTQNDLKSNSFENSLIFNTLDKNELKLMYGSNNTSLMALSLNSSQSFSTKIHISRLYSDGISKVRDQSVKNLENDFFVSNNFFARVDKKIHHLNPYLGFYIIDGKQDIDGFNSASFTPEDLIENDLSTYKQYIFLIGTRYKKNNLHRFNIFYNSNKLKRIENTPFLFKYNSNAKRVTFDQEHIFSELLNFKIFSFYEDENAFILNDSHSRNKWLLAISNKMIFKNFSIKPYFKVYNESDYSYPLGIDINTKFHPRIESTLSLSQTKKYPSLFQLFDSSSGNKKLNPENLQKINLRNLYKGPFFTLSKDLFFYKMNNKISFDRKYLNIERSTHYGLEINSKIKSSIAIFNLAYRYLNASDKENSQLPLIPEHKARVGVEKTFSNIQANFNAIYKSSTTSFSKNKISSYMLFNLGLAYKINKNFNIDINFHNLFNSVYEDIEYYNTRGFSSYASISFTP